MASKADVAAANAIEALSAHAYGKDSKHDERVLLEALGNKHYRLVAKAAEIAGERLCYGVIAGLKDAYSRFLTDAPKKDPQCFAKQAIVRALVGLDCSDASFYLAGMQYRQMEPVWGGSADTAVDVRASCAMGLANSGYPRAAQEIAILLNDTEPRARSGAARALACANRGEAEALLRFKVLVGDAEPEVVGECLAALLAVAPAECVAFVAQQLSHQDEAVREFAAIALGESQLPEALSAIQQAWENAFVSTEQKRALTRAAALHRSDAAFAWLLGLIAEGSSTAGEAALEALAIYKENPALKARVVDSVAMRGNARLEQMRAKLWT